MKEINKMLESLSKSNMNYSHNLNIDFKEMITSNDTKSNSKYIAQRYKMSFLKFIPTALLSCVVIWGTVLIIKNIRHTIPIVNSSNCGNDDISETSSLLNNEHNEFSGAENKVQSVFPNINIPKTMTFKLNAVPDEYKQYISNSLLGNEYSIDDPKEISFIIELISDNCVEKTDKYMIKNYQGKEMYSDTSDSCFPYSFDLEDDRILIPRQICFIPQDSNTELVILNEYLLLNQNGIISYYKLKKNIYYEIFEKIFVIVNEKAENISNAVVCKLTDQNGNELPLYKKEPRRYDNSEFNYLFCFDLSQTEFANIPTGSYTSPDTNIYLSDENGEQIELTASNFKIGVYEEEEKKLLNILVIARSENNLAGNTLKGSFQNIIKTDEAGGTTHEEYSYNLNFDFNNVTTYDKGY